MADDIGGLQVDFTAEASQLRSELQRMEQQLRAFDRAHGRHKVQITADFREPGQRRLDDMRRGLQSQLDKGAPLRPPITLGMPSERELARFSSALGRVLPATTVKVKGVWDGWQTAPPKSITMRVQGGGGGSAALAAGDRPATVRAPGATTNTGPPAPNRDEVRAAREASRRRERTGAAAATVPVPRPQSAANRQAARLAANEARAAAQTKTASRSEVFRDYTDQMLLEDYLDKNTPPGHRNKLADELRSRGFTPPALGATGGGARGFVPPAAPQPQAKPRPPVVMPAWRRRALEGEGLAKDMTGGARGFTGGGAPMRAGIYPHYTETGTQSIHAATVAAMGRRGELTRPLQGMYDAYPLSGSIKRPGATAGLMAAAGLDEDKIARTMGRAIDKAGPLATAVGKPWYQRAGPIMEGLSANMPQPRENRVMAGAVFSTQASWEENLRNAQDFFDVIHSGAGSLEEVQRMLRALPVRGGKNPTMLGTIAKAYGTLYADNPEAYLRGPKGQQNPKIANFGGNLLGNLDLNTADRHETMGATGQRFSTPGNRAAADILERASRRAAQKRGLQTAEGQAIRWAGYLGGEIAGPDPLGFERSQGAAGNLWVPRRPQKTATPSGNAPNIAAFMSPTPGELMQSPSSQIDEFGMPTGAAQQRYGEMQARERTASERAVVAANQQWNRQQAAQQRMFGRWAAPASSGYGVAAFNGGLRGPGGQFASERQIESAAGVGAPGAPNWSRPQRTAAAPGSSPAAQAAIDLKSLSTAAQDMLGQIKNFPEMEAAFRKSVPDLFAEIDAAQKQANLASAAKAEGGKPLRTAEEIALQRIHRITGGEGSDAERQAAFLEASRTGVREARGVQQTLSLGRTLGSMTAGALGGTRDKGRIDQLVRLQSEYARVGRAGSDAFEKVELAQTALDKATIQQAPDEDIKRLTKAYDEANDEAQLFRNEQARIVNDAAKIEGKISKPIAALRGSFSALTGALVGGFVYSAAIDGITALAGALEKPVDAIGGYVGAASKLEASLGQTTRSLHGHASVAVAAASAQAGLGNQTYEAIAPLVTERAAIQAGNEAFGEQLDIIRSASLFRAQQRSAQRGEAYGLGITPGALPGISGSTGGLFGSAFGGQMPLIEQLAGLTPQGTRGQRAGFAAAGGLGGALAGAATGAALGLAGGPFAPITVAGGALFGGLAGLLGGAGIGGAVGPELAGFSDIDLSGGRPGRAALPTGRGAGRLAGFAAAANAQGARTGQGPELTEKQADHIENLKLAVSDLSEAAVRATPSLKGIMAAVDSGDAEAIKATAEAMKGWVPEDQVEALRRSGFAVTGQGGQALGRRELQQYFQSAVRGASIPSAQLAAQQAIKPLAAQLQLMQWQGQQQRETLLPGQQYINQLASGRAQAGGALRGPFGIRELPPEVARTAPNFEAGTEALTGLQQQMEKTAKAGRSGLITMLTEADSILSKASGSTSNLTGEFKALEKSVSFNAGAMRGLQIENMWAQTTLQVNQYNEQLRIANRSLDDANSFISGIGAGELGILQHRERGLQVAAAEVGFRQQELGLQSQQLGLLSSGLSVRSRELQLMQSQRQINFQMAMAGFAAPGTTPEERTARMEAAKIEANFAQQQQNIGVEALGIDRQQIALQAENVALSREALGISKEQFSVQQAMITVNATRAVEDLTNQINLLTQARTVTLQVAVNNESIAAYQDQIAADVEKIQSLIETAANARVTVMQNSAALLAAYPGTLAGFNSILLNGLNDYLVGARNVLSNTFYGTSPTGYSSGNSGTDYKGPTATGYVGTVSGASQFTVGEAGTETVAIIRNPRNLQLTPESGSSSGSGITVVVDVHDNQLSSATDADRLAGIIARKVEEKLGDRARAMGLGLGR